MSSNEECTARLRADLQTMDELTEQIHEQLRKIDATLRMPPPGKVGTFLEGAAALVRKHLKINDQLREERRAMLSREIDWTMSNPDEAEKTSRDAIEGLQGLLATIDTVVVKFVPQPGQLN